MKKTLLGASCVLAMAAMFGSAHAAVTFDSNYLQVLAVAEASNSDNTGYEEIPGYGGGVSYFQNPTTAEAAAAYTVTDGVLQATATDDEAATESLTGPSSGMISFTGVTSATASDPSASALAYQGEGEVEIVFDVSAPATFNLNYALTDSSQDGFSDTYALYDPAINYYAYGLNLINTSGAISYKLLPGTYELDVYETRTGYYGYESNDYISQSGIGSQTGSHDDTFSFSISGAPEPSVWVLTIAGVGLVGGALRYGRRRPALAAA